jgi:hypothetical protein
MNHKNFYIDWQNKPKTYFVPPPFISSTLSYQNVNKDPELRKSVTYFFLDKSIKWITNYKEFNHLKKILPRLKSNEGYIIVYNLLRKFVNENNLNWYDLRQIHYEIVKDYLKYNFGKF